MVRRPDHGGRHEYRQKVQVHRPGWLDSKKAHYNWCFNANPPFSAMQNEMDIRKKMLKGC
jgi:hypothetical protein